MQQRAQQQAQQQAQQDQRTQLRDQLQQMRDQVRAQVAQAREQAALAREQAALARQQARDGAVGSVTVPPATGPTMIHMPSIVMPPMPPMPPMSQFPTSTSFPGDFGRGGPMQSIPEAAMVITLAFFAMIVLCVIGWPLARAFGRRMDRNTARSGTVPNDVTERLTRIEQQVEAIAIEIERVSEGQRYSTKLLTEMREIPALPAAVAGERVPVERR
jgi:hypothetical protein